MLSPQGWWGCLTAKYAKNAKILKQMSQLLYKDECYRIMGACFEVYKELGCGLKEPVYHEALQEEFRIQGLPAIHEPTYEISYKGKLLKSTFEPDFVCFGEIVVELKSVKELSQAHEAQVQNYLRAGKMKLGILVNFGHYPKIDWKRIVLEERRNDPPILQG